MNKLSSRMTIAPFTDKSILSLNRLEKMMWIKDTLEDATALMKQGWDKQKKRYDNNKRVNMAVFLIFKPFY